MKKYLRYIIGGIVILASLALPILLDRSDDSAKRGRTFPMMGTVGNISLVSEQEELAEKALDEAQQIIREIEAVCNVFNPESELSRLNRSAYGKEFVCSPLLWEMLTEADRAWKSSAGAYDPTVQELMKLWGFRRKRRTLPTEAERAEAMKKTGWDKVVLDREKHSVRFAVEGIGIDLGGIAKGFALEKVLDSLRKAGIRRAVVDLGGNIGCLAGEKQPPFRIGVRDPESPDRQIAVFEMTNECVATSGNYERYVIIDGKQYTHIMDPRTGDPVSGVLSVTVITPRGTDSDALSTAVFVGGEKLAEKVCRELPGTGVFIIRHPQGKADGMEIRRFGSFAR